MEAGIKQFDEQGESAVTKELVQFNKYKVFEPKHANDLSEEDRKNVLSLLISKREEELSNKGKVLCKWECPEGACCNRESSGANGGTRFSIYNIHY